MRYPITKTIKDFKNLKKEESSYRIYRNCQ